MAESKSYSYSQKRFMVYDPIKKVNVFKSFNTSKMNPEEIEERGKAWIKDKKKEFEAMIIDLNNQSQYDVSPFVYSVEDYSGQSIMMIGSTRSGKSTVLSHLMNNYFLPKENKFINILFTNSLQAPVYDEFRDKKNVATSLLYQPKVIKECYDINSKTDNHYKFNLILDDIVDKKFDKQLMKLLTIYRNSKMSTIICSQAVQIMNATGRTNINHVFLFKLNSCEQIEKAVKCFLLGYFPSSMKMVDKIKKYQELTADHHFIYINNIEGTIIRTKIKI
jgi:hypothetical protein